MKTKTYRSKGISGRTYMKPCGNGVEVGFLLNGNVVFVGNFIHTKEANVWWNLLNREIRQFSRKYSVGRTFPLSWFKHFISNHLYKTYYSFLDGILARHNKTLARAVMKDVRKYQQIKKKWNSSERVPFLKVA